MWFLGFMLTWAGAFLVISSFGSDYANSAAHVFMFAGGIVLVGLGVFAQRKSYE